MFYTSQQSRAALIEINDNLKEHGLMNIQLEIRLSIEVPTTLTTF